MSASRQFNDALSFQPDTSEIYHVEDEHDYKNFFRLAKTSDYSDLQDILRPNQTEYDDLGHQLDDLIVQCSFDRENCNTRLALDWRYQPITLLKSLLVGSHF